MGAWGHVKDLLEKEYPHPLRAWRCLLDKDDSNSLSWTEFRDACRKLKVEGIAASAWRVLDTDLDGSVSMLEYNPESAELLRSFKEWVEVNFGSIRQCFHAIDSDKSGAVTFAELKRACFKLNWPGDVRLLFKCLDTDDSREDHRKTLSLEEVSFLESWQFEPTAVELDGTEASRTLAKPRATLRSSASLPSQGIFPIDGCSPAHGRPSTTQSL